MTWLLNKYQFYLISCILLAVIIFCLLALKDLAHREYIAQPESNETEHFAEEAAFMQDLLLLEKDLSMNVAAIPGNSIPLKNETTPAKSVPKRRMTATEHFAQYVSLLSKKYPILTAYRYPDSHQLNKIALANIQELECLALNIYHEARGEAPLGRRAVAHVVMNRVKHVGFPKSVCGVVKQGGEERRYHCQFTWWCDGQSDRPRNKKSWRESVTLAAEILQNKSKDPTWGALWYHADYVSPYWRGSMQKGPKIGKHIFYSKRRRSTSTS